MFYLFNSKQKELDFFSLYKSDSENFWGYLIMTGFLAKDTKPRFVGLSCIVFAAQGCGVGTEPRCSYFRFQVRFFHRFFILFKKMTYSIHFFTRVLIIICCNACISFKDTPSYRETYPQPHNYFCSR